MSKTLAPLTIEHLGYLWEQELLTSPLIHLGPMPINRMTLTADQAAADLQTRGFLTRDGKLTPLATTIVNTMLVPDDAWWGLILLRDQARSGPIDVPEDWRRFGLEKSVMTIPRVFFTVAYSGPHCVVAVRSGNNVSLALAKSSAPREAQAAQILLEVLNPRREWKPAAGFSELMVPHAATAQVGTVGQTGDQMLDGQIRAHRRKVYSEQGMQQDEIDRMLGLLESTSEVAASMQVQHMNMVGETTPSAFSIDLFYKLGMVLTYPTVGYDRQWWLRIITATESNVAEAVKGIQNLPHFRFDPHSFKE